MLSLAVGAIVGLTLVVPGAAVAGGGGHCEEPVAEAAGTRVTIKQGCFAPAVLHVEAGDTVTWTNRDPVDHNVIGAGGAWGSQTLFEAGAFSRRFNSVGTHPYVCTFHPGMVGAVVVGEPSVTDEAASTTEVDEGAGVPVTTAGGMGPGQRLVLQVFGVFALIVVALAVQRKTLLRDRKAGSNSPA